MPGVLQPFGLREKYRYVPLLLSKAESCISQVDEGGSVSKLSLTIPFEAPTVNHYVKHTRSGRHYLTPKAIAWKDAVAIIARGQSVTGKTHEITYTVFQGAGSKGDVDNYAKCILDALVKAGVLKSDASIVAMHAYKKRDRENPRTEIHLEAL